MSPLHSLLSVALSSFLAVSAPAEVSAAAVDATALATLGRALFFDVNLSLHRSQSCATCHDPAHGFVDTRDNGVGGAVSRGADQRALGDRNAPSAAYAALAPPFSRDSHGHYFGGLFHDGRARDGSELRVTTTAESPSEKNPRAARPRASAVSVSR